MKSFTSDTGVFASVHVLNLSQIRTTEKYHVVYFEVGIWI